MANFLVLYRSSVSAADQMASGGQDMAAGMDEWMAWMGKVGGALKNPGSPLAEAAEVPPAHANGGSHIGGYSVLEADSVDAVKGLLEGHPHFHSPDASIQVLECLAVPGMG